MPVLDTWKERIKKVPLLARPMRAARLRFRTLSDSHTHIEAQRGIPSLRLRELWDFRELLVLMAFRDFQIRYKQTILGVAWAVIPTLLNGLIFTLLFGKIAKLGDESLPYAAFYFAAALPWNFFNYILTQSSVSLTSNFNLLRKMYFPRLILPVKCVLVASVDFLLASSLLIAAMIYYRLVPSGNIVWLPVFLLMALLTGLGVGMWFAALNVYFRDIGNFLPFCIQLWFFVTPVFYNITILREPWHTLIRLNPMTCVCTGFRWALFDNGPPPDLLMVLVFVLTLAMTVSGTYYFRKVERTIADVV